MKEEVHFLINDFDLRIGMMAALLESGYTLRVEESPKGAYVVVSVRADDVRDPLET